MTSVRLSREFLEDKLALLTKVSYNRFYWHRRYKSKDTLDKKYPLYEKIAHGDFDFSDYYYQADHEMYLMNDKLKSCKTADEEHEVRSLFLERRRKLLVDFEKEEKDRMQKLKSEFCKVFRLKSDELETIMENFEGSLLDLYNHIKKSYYERNKSPENIDRYIRKVSRKSISDIGKRS